MRSIVSKIVGLSLGVAGLCLPAGAQYKRVTALSGIQSFEDNAVTVTWAGYPLTTNYLYRCGVGPYTVGQIVALFSITTPISFTFTFDGPVEHIRIDLNRFWRHGGLSVRINNTPYTLSSSQLISLPNNMCNYPDVTIGGGNILPGTGIIHSGRVQLHEPAIQSLTITYFGTIYTLGGSGATFSFYFGQINASNDGPVCIGDTLQLWGDTTISEPGTFHWSGPNGYSSDEQNPVISPLTEADTGIYTLTYVSGVDTFTDTTHVTFLPGPAVPVISADNPVCAGSTLELSAANTPGATYEWLGPNGFSGNGSVVTIPNVQEVNAGLYTVKASLYDCHPEASKEIVLTQPVINSFTELACSNTGYDFNGNQLYEPGVYTDTFPGSNGCDSINKLNLVVLPGPEVTASFQEGLLCLGDTIMLYAQGDAQGHTWYSQESDSIGSGPELPFVLQQIRNQVTLAGTAANDCRDTFNLDIMAEGCCQASIPNAFSPNGDGINDVFAPVTEGNFQNYRLDVFNRWGQRVFSSFSQAQGWDGTSNGVPAIMGTYHYYITGYCLEGTVLKKKCDMLLIR